MSIDRLAIKETKLLNIQKIYDAQSKEGFPTIHLNKVDFDHLLRQAKNAIAYEKTLKFYENRDNYINNVTELGEWNISIIDADFGKRAQDTLEENF